MKIMNVEKRILMNEKIDQILNLNAQENLRIQIESDGKRCLGYVDLKGQYLIDYEVKDFHEYIECNIFAPIYKCNSDEFVVTLSDVNGVVDDGILVNLSFNIEGISEEDQYSYEDEELDLLGLEDLFEENENLYTNATLIIAKENDTYESIAQRYSVSENELRKVNNDTEIQAKQCILIPKA